MRLDDRSLQGHLLFLLFLASSLLAPVITAWSGDHLFALVPIIPTSRSSLPIDTMTSDRLK